MSAKRMRQKSEDKHQAEEPPLPRELVARFFREIGERGWTDAEKELDMIRQKSGSGDWSRGYVKALEGIMISLRNGDDRYIFLPKILQNITPASAEALRQEFAEFSRGSMHGTYDRGFFRALEDYLSLSPRVGSEPVPEPSPQPIGSPKQELGEE